MLVWLADGKTVPKGYVPPYLLYFLFLQLHSHFLHIYGVVCPQLWGFLHEFVTPLYVNIIVDYITGT